MARVLGMTVDPVTLTQLWPHVLQRGIGDRITCRMQPNATGSASTFVVIIEGIGHAIDTGAGTWSTTYALRAADVAIATWDHSVWDGADLRTW
jgi:hypothetical protein